MLIYEDRAKQLLVVKKLLLSGLSAGVQGLQA